MFKKSRRTRLTAVIIAIVLCIAVFMTGCNKAPADKTPASKPSADSEVLDSPENEAKEDKKGNNESEGSEDEESDEKSGESSEDKNTKNSDSTTKKETVTNTQDSTTKAQSTTTTKTQSTTTTTKKAATTSTTAKTATTTAESYTPGFSHFKAVDIDGNTVTQSVFQGKKVTMINFWATWCGPCVGEMPDLAALNAKYASQGFQVIGVIIDADSGDYRRVMNETGANYRMLKLGNASSDMYNIMYYHPEYSGGIPFTVFVDSSGKQIGNAYTGAYFEYWDNIVSGLLG